MIKQKVSECKITENASDDDVSQFLNGDPSLSVKAKCLLSCMQEAFGLV